MRSKGTISYSFKTAINLFLEKQMYNTAVLDGIMQKHSTNSSQDFCFVLLDET
jgi:hypothetical protein